MVTHLEWMAQDLCRLLRQMLCHLDRVSAELIKRIHTTYRHTKIVYLKKGHLVNMNNFMCQCKILFQIMSPKKIFSTNSCFDCQRTATGHIFKKYSLISMSDSFALVMDDFDIVMRNIRLVILRLLRNLSFFGTITKYNTLVIQD